MNEKEKWVQELGESVIKSYTRSINGVIEYEYVSRRRTFDDAFGSNNIKNKRQRK